MIDDTFTRGMRGEFRGDFTRDTFDPLRHFSRVLMQQGRVQLDSDWNEQVSILLHSMRRALCDIGSEHWGPAGTVEKELCGFSITPKQNDLLIGVGHYYVNGIFCENINEPFYYKDQLGYPFPGSPEYEDIIKNNKAGKYLIYLDVWERHISYVEDDYIREKALGGPDTTTRAKVIWQVRIKSVENNYEDYKGNYQAFLVALSDARKPGSGKLKARAKKNEKPDEPCLISPESHYRGAENQLYRVEIHTSGITGEATFKWSRENGSVIFPIRKIQGNDVSLEHLGKDTRFSLKPGDWVEIVDDNYELQQRAEPLRRVDSVDRETMKVTLGGTQPVGQEPEKHPYLRRWDQKNGTENGVSVEIRSDNSIWLPLEDGLEIQFATHAEEAPAAATNDNRIIFQTGDYWLIPARTATGDVEWPGPVNDPTALSPQGVEHHYAPLAVITLDNNAQITDNKDLRRKLKSIWE